MMDPRKILARASLLALAAAAVALVGWGRDAALGVLLAGAVAVLDFWLLGRRVNEEVRLVVSGKGSALRAGLLSSLRLGGALLMVWWLLGVFQPVALIVGLAVVVAAIVLEAALAAFRDPLDVEA